MKISKISNLFSLIIAVPAIYLASISSAQASNLINGTVGKHDETVRYESFSVKESGITTIDVDAFSMDLGNGKSKLNPHIYLFKDDGRLDETDLIAQSNMFDKKIEKDNSPTRFDPYLSEFLEVGDYILAISGGDFTLEESLTQKNDSSSFGDYQIKFSSNVIINNSSPKNKNLPLPKSPILEESISSIQQTIITEPERVPIIETTYTNKLVPPIKDFHSSEKASEKASVPEPTSILGLLAISALSTTSAIKRRRINNPYSSYTYCLEKE